MTSLISALSLLILVLANGYFAVPILDEFTSTPFLSLHDDLTTEHAVNLRFVSDGEATESPIEMTTSHDSLSDENASRASRLFDEFVTTEKSSIEEREFKDLSFTTPESFTEVIEHHARGVEDEGETATEVAADKRDIPIESSTVFIPSSVAPEHFVKESTTTLSPPLQIDVFESSKKKYIGLLEDDKEHEEDTKKKLPKKPLKKPTEDKSSEESKLKSKDSSEEVVKVKSPKKQLKYEQEDDTKDLSAPTAVFDQEALKDLSTIPNGVMVLDESNDPIVTVIPDKLSKTNTENKKEQKQLNQGSTLLLFLLAALLLCACVTASTLAFVRNRHTLKRKSRITEMEAHLDEHYHHPLIFQHHEK